MQVVTNLKDLRFFSKTVVAIGVFDGVHKAHRLIITSAIKLARQRRTKALVLTFWPHPQGQASLNSLAHRLRLIGELKADICVVIRFDRSFAKIGAEDYIGPNSIIGFPNREELQWIVSMRDKEMKLEIAAGTIAETSPEQFTEEPPAERA